MSIQPFNDIKMQKNVVKETWPSYRAGQSSVNETKVFDN